MPYYLMHFDRSTLAEPTFEEFFDRDEASDRHDEAERMAPEHVDVVLFGAQSVDALRVTHSSYFMGSRPRIDRRERLQRELEWLREERTGLEERLQRNAEREAAAEAELLTL